MGTLQGSFSKGFFHAWTHVGSQLWVLIGLTGFVEWFCWKGVILLILPRDFQFVWFFLAFLTLAIIRGELLSQKHHHSDLRGKSEEQSDISGQIIPSVSFLRQFPRKVKALLTQTAMAGPPACYLFIPIDFYSSSPEVSLYCPELKLDFLRIPTSRLQGLWHIGAKQGCQNNDFTHISRGASVVLPLICHNLAGDALYMSLPDLTSHEAFLYRSNPAVLEIIRDMSEIIMVKKGDDIFLFLFKSSIHSSLWVNFLAL